MIPGARALWSTLCLLSLSLLATGCEQKFSYGGQNIYEHFPLDGSRAWEYANEDTSLSLQLRVEKDPTSRMVDGVEIFTLRTYDKADLTELYRVEWSSDSSGGVQVWSYVDSQESPEGTVLLFDPPLAVADASMEVGDQVKTTTGGYSFTSSFEGNVDCPNHWVTDAWECVHILLDDGDGDSNTGPAFAGDWYLAADWGPSRFVPTGFTQPWVLTRAEWSADEE